MLRPLSVIAVTNLLFRYDNEGFCLDIPDLQIEQRERVAVVGPSGCGKTTLLHLLAGIKSAEQGTIRIGDTSVMELSDASRRRFRIQNIGLVFQEFELLSYLSVRDNILLPYRLHSALQKDRQTSDRLIELARNVGIDDKLDRNIQHLSQGERQRAAICRALLTEPDLLLADEPTGNLDPENKLRIMRLLLTQARAHESSFIAVTHDYSVLDEFDRVIDMREWIRPDASERLHAESSEA